MSGLLGRLLALMQPDEVGNVLHAIIPGFWLSCTGAAGASALLKSLDGATAYGKVAAPATDSTGRDGGSGAPGSLLARAVAWCQGPVPKRWFVHFYALATAWTCAVWLSAALGRAPPPVALALFQLHAVRRLLECLLVHRFSDSATMPRTVYFFGLLHYLMVPLTWALSDAKGGAAPRPPLQALRALPAWRLALGAALFTGGSLLQWHSHRVLAALRPQRAQQQTQRYSIPRGGAFELVSSPHYLGEIALYVGLALLQPGNDRAKWPLVLWVASNLSVTAHRTHRWYHSTFDDYPRQRRRLLPWLF